MLLARGLPGYPGNPDSANSLTQARGAVLAESVIIIPIIHRLCIIAPAVRDIVDSCPGYPLQSHAWRAALVALALFPMLSTDRCA